MDRKVTHLGMIFVGSLVLGGTVVFASRKLFIRAGGVTRIDLGNVGRLQDLQAVQEIRNEHDKVMILSGFDKACGLRARLDGPPILAPGASARLLLQGNSGRRPGPAGASFTLTQNVGGKSASRSYVLFWNVSGGPWLSKSEVWLGSENSFSETIEIHDGKPGAEILVKSAPPWLQLERAARQLKITSRSDRPAVGELICFIRENDKSTDYTIPVQVQGGSATRLHPETVFLDASRDQVVELRIVGTAGVAQLKLRYDHARLNIRRVEDKLMVSALKSNRKGAAEIVLRRDGPRGGEVVRLRGGSVKALRLIILSYTALAACIAILHRFSIDIIPCRSGCVAVQESPLSIPASVVGLVILGALFYSVALDRANLFRWGVIASLLGSVVLLGLMFKTGQACELCVATHLGVFSLALTALRPAGLGFAAGSLLLALGGGAQAYGIVRSVSPKPRPATFLPRTWEQPISSEADCYVVFSDPECSKCKDYYRSVEKRARNKVRILHRWYILPQNSDTAVPAAIIAETLLRRNAELGQKFVGEIFDTDSRLTRDHLREIGDRLGCRDVIDSELNSPSKESLDAVASDAEVGRSAGVSGVPTLFLVSKSVAPARKLYWTHLDVLRDIAGDVNMEQMRRQ